MSIAPRDYCLYNTPMWEMVEAPPRDREKYFTLGTLRCQFVTVRVVDLMKKYRTDRVAFTYFVGDKKHLRYIPVIEYDWSLYDYLLILSQSVGVNLDIGGAYQF